MRYSCSSLLLWSRSLLIVLSGCFLISAAGLQAFGKGSYAIKPPQSWVRPLDLESTTTEPSSASSTFLLDDHQIRVSQTVDRYYHHIQKIETAAGLADMSQLRFYFEPSYQQLAIHFIRIRRNGESLNSLRPSEIKVIQQEEGLDQQLYNGTLAAIIFLNDLRVGDIVDYAYTISGENPVLGGRYAEVLYLAGGEPFQHLKFRLVWPSARTLKIRNANIEIEPTVTQVGNESEYVWERRGVPATDTEDRTPGWFDPYPTVSLSEFQTWCDVVQWALPLYVSANPLPPELLAKVHKWQTEFGTPQERTVAALRFVQDEIRYLGIELGRYSHQPTLPAKVFARRFGDCKDKTLLLVTILKEMGLDATPALVNSVKGRLLDRQQPSPFGFDHVIVRLQIDGKVYWLDPTISYQRGGLEKYYDPAYERALELRDGITDLEKIPLPTNDAGRIVILEKYEAKNSEGPISLVVKTAYEGAEADGMRYYLSQNSLSELSKYYLNYYADENPSIKAEGLPQVADDTNANRVLIEERYLIDKFWKERKHTFLAEKIISEVGKPNVTQRSMPMRISYPVSIQHTIQINLSEPYEVDADRGTISNNAVRFDYDFSRRGNTVKLVYSLKTLADSIPVETIPQHLLVLDRINNLLAFEFTQGSTGVRFSRRENGAVEIVVGVVMMVGLLTLVCVVLIRDRLKKKAAGKFAQTLKPKIGSSPDTAIGVRADSDVDLAVQGYKCGCGQTPYTQESPPQRERFTYDGERMVGIRFNCPNCRRPSDLYFRIWSAQPGETPSPQTNY